MLKHIVSFKYRLSYLIYLIALFFVSELPAYANFKNLEVSVAVGRNQAKIKDTTMVISNNETDTVHMANSNKSNFWKVGIGYSFFDNYFKRRSFINRLLVELNFYYNKGTLKGEIWQYGLAEFDNYGFKAPLTSMRIMVDFKPQLFTWAHISPYPILGVGLVRNTIGFTEYVTSPDVDPATELLLPAKTKASLAYNFGFGMRFAFSNHISATLEYLDIRRNKKLTPASASSNHAALLTPPNFTMQNRAILLGVKWIF